MCQSELGAATRAAGYSCRMVASNEMRVARLGQGDLEAARRTFTVMAEVFEEDHVELSIEYLQCLLARSDFWCFTATVGDETVGGLTAHTLMMTSVEAAEVFLYDIAVHADYQRLGIGRGLVEALRRDASTSGIETVFVPADNDDTHALDFYRALGGTPSQVTFFEFGRDERT